MLSATLSSIIWNSSNLFLSSSVKYPASSFKIFTFYLDNSGPVSPFDYERSQHQHIPLCIEQCFFWLGQELNQWHSVSKALNLLISGSDFQAAPSFLSFSELLEYLVEQTEPKVLRLVLWSFSLRHSILHWWALVLLSINNQPFSSLCTNHNCALLKIQIQKVTTSGVCPPYLGLMGKGDHSETFTFSTLLPLGWWLM